MTIMQGVLTSPKSGDVVRGKTFKVKVVTGASGLAFTAGGQIVGDSTVTSGADGSWSVDLAPTSGINPAGTHYALLAFNKSWAFFVPDSGPAQFEDCLLDNPDAPGAVQVGLLPSNNLSDVANAATALAHLGGISVTAAHSYTDSGVTAAEAFATAADTALATLVGTKAAAVTVANMQRINVRDYGAIGDGTTDDTAAIQAASAAMAAYHCLYFPRGSYRFTQQSPALGAAVVLSGLSNIGVEMEPGAELLMDNLNAGAGTSHGFSILGAADNVTLINCSVRWKTAPSSRSAGDGFRALGYPSDSAPPGTWTTTTGTVKNIQLINCTTVAAPQTGAIFMGCSDIRVVNFRAENTWADGLHFNACRRANVYGHTAIASGSAGDDGLAFVTYYDATTVPRGSSGPFNQPSLGSWSNYDSQATGIVVSGGVADGVRVAGSLNVSIGNVTVEGKSGAAGVIVDSAIVGTGVAWPYLASVGISIDNVNLRACAIGLQVVTHNINSGNDSSYWKFGLRMTGVSIRDCTNWSIITQGDGSQTTAIAGLHLTGIKVTAGTGGGGNGAVLLGSLRDSLVTNLTMETSNNAALTVQGQDLALTGALSTLPRHNLILDNLQNTGGKILLQDLRDVTVGKLRSYNSGGSGVQLIRVIDFEVQSIKVSMANRLNTGTVRAVLLQKTAQVGIGSIAVAHDSNNTTTWSSLEIGGGDATDIAALGLRVEKLTYTNTLNQSGADITIQGGGNGPNDYVYRAAWWNGGEGSPVWRTQHAGKSASMVESLIGSGSPLAAVTAPPGSMYRDRTGGGLWVKSSATDATGWLQASTAASSLVYLKSGYYTPVTVSIGATGTSAALGNGSLRLHPVDIVGNVTLTRIGMEVTAIGDVGSTFAMCVFADSGQWPGALLLDTSVSGSASTSLSNGLIDGHSATSQEITISLALTPGRYWFGAVLQNVTVTQPTVRILSTTSSVFGLPLSTTLPTANFGPNNAATQSGVTGSLPNPFTGTTVSTIMPRIFVKAA